MKISVERFWQFLIYGTGALVLWLTASFVTHCVLYSRYQNSVEGVVFNKKIVESRPDVHRIQIELMYTIEGERFASEHYLQRQYPNFEAATEAMECLDHRIDVWWYGPKGQPMISLEKAFPYKGGIRCLVSLLVFVYFIILREVTRRRRLAHNL